MTGARLGSQAPDPGDASQQRIHAPLGGRAAHPREGSLWFGDESRCGPEVPPFCGPGNRPGPDRNARADLLTLALNCIGCLVPGTIRVSCVGSRFLGD